MVSAKEDFAEKTGGKGLVIAAPMTGSGKTLVTLGLLRAFRRRGLSVAALKVGPDYIDPRFHEIATGRACANLDGWAMAPARIAALARAAVREAQLVLVEGVMGLFDGAAREDGHLGAGATADVAAFLNWPVVLVVDVSRLGQSAGALVQGFLSYDPRLSVAGVILNQLGGARHEAIVRAGLAPVSVPILGALPRERDLALPSRHLGLVQAEEHTELEALLDRAADHLENHCDLDALAALARPLSPHLPHTPAPSLPPMGQRIAVARDAAFGFAYTHLLADWRAAGAEILPFSPLADEAPDPTADAVYLPGGYPELHAGKLAAAHNFLSALRQLAQAGRPIHGECGGYMVLGQGLVDERGQRHAMAGLLGLESSFAEKRLHLRYGRLRALSAFGWGTAGAQFRAHEFHYAKILAETGAPLFETPEGEQTGLRNGSVSGSFWHVIDEESSDEPPPHHPA